MFLRIFKSFTGLAKPSTKDFMKSKSYYAALHYTKAFGKNSKADIIFLIDDNSVPIFPDYISNIAVII